MFSYRHAFHAGNFADVLKHLVLMLCIEHMNRKDKPYLFLDTHAGAGHYDLMSNIAKQTGECLDGIGRLWDVFQHPNRGGMPEALAHYVSLIADTAGNRKATTELKAYPGSASIAARLARETDTLRFCELHSTDLALLRRHFKDAGRRIRVEQIDGFEALKAAMPPPSRRGLVLIDPSYEIKSDYVKVVAAMKDALKRFATGTYLIWLPVMPTLDANGLPEKLRKLGASSWLYASINVRAPSPQGRGMHGSGIFVINPPWQLKQTLEDTLPWLSDMLGQDDKASWSLEAFEANGKDS